MVGGSCMLCISPELFSIISVRPNPLQCWPVPSFCRHHWLFYKSNRLFHHGQRGYCILFHCMTKLTSAPLPVTLRSLIMAQRDILDLLMKWANQNGSYDPSSMAIFDNISSHRFQIIRKMREAYGHFNFIPF